MFYKDIIIYSPYSSLPKKKKNQFLDRLLDILDKTLMLNRESRKVETDCIAVSR